MQHLHRLKLNLQLAIAGDAASTATDTYNNSFVGCSKWHASFFTIENMGWFVQHLVFCKGVKEHGKTYPQPSLSVATALTNDKALLYNLLLRTHMSEYVTI